MTNAPERLPKELMDEILNQCGPSTLASLALMQKKFQHEAEHKLYSSIVVQTNPSSIAIFETLGSNQRKAESVLFLQMEDAYDPDPLALKTFLSILPKLSSLRDLRVRFCMIPEEGQYDRLSKCTQDTADNITIILKAQYFTLRTLFCNEWFALLDIVQAQTSLEILGIYDWNEHIEPGTLRLLDYLRTVPIRPLTFAVGSDTYAPVFHMLGIFTCFLPPHSTERFNVFKAIAEAMDHDRAQRMILRREYVHDPCLFFETFSNIHAGGSLATMISDMATCFPNIQGLMLHAREPSQLDLTSIKTVIAPLRRLVKFESFGWYGHPFETNGLPGWGDPPNAIDLHEKLHYAQEWEDTCPKLSIVWFPDGKHIEKRGSFWTEV